MEIQCPCGQFRARLKAFPSGTPGRLVCYCDDCQRYARHLGRADLLDAHGGTEVIPAYPAEVAILQGQERRTCPRLSSTGPLRFSTTCCDCRSTRHDGSHRQAAELALPDALVSALAEAFEALTPGRQRSHVIHLEAAKRPATRISRIAACRDKMLAGKGATER